MNRLTDYFSWMENRAERLMPEERLGKVVQVTGLIVESEGPDVSLGSICEIRSMQGEPVGRAEVVGFKESRVLLMPLEEIKGIKAGFRVVSTNHGVGVPVGDALKGRVIDGMGQPIDGLGPIAVSYEDRLIASAPNPMKRARVIKQMETGIRSIDTFIPLGIGQRMGIFAGTGVGKSTLLGMLARGATSDINVIALVGERGRELRDFIETDLGHEGLKKTVLVVSTSDQPAPLRLRAALMATAIAEYFRDQGNHVLFLMDSLTRLAMAQREIGLAIGEPPTARGYTPSVFSLLPRLVERTGMSDNGSITALYAVLVEGDDLNEPISDTVRGIVDGHISLSRALAVSNHYPAIDILESISRLSSVLLNKEEIEKIGQARDLLAAYRKSEDLIQVGAYVPKTNPRVDKAIACHEAFNAFLKQKKDEITPKNESFGMLSAIIG